MEKTCLFLIFLPLSWIQVSKLELEVHFISANNSESISNNSSKETISMTTKKDNATNSPISPILNHKELLLTSTLAQKRKATIEIQDELLHIGCDNNCKVYIDKIFIKQIHHLSTYSHNPIIRIPADSEQVAIYLVDGGLGGIISYSLPHGFYNSTPSNLQCTHRNPETWPSFSYEHLTPSQACKRVRTLIGAENLSWINLKCDNSITTEVFCVFYSRISVEALSTKQHSVAIVFAAIITSLIFSVFMYTFFHIKQ